MTNGRLVYSTNPEINKRCSRCKELMSECNCAAATEIPQTVTAILRLETAKRGGKKVTTIGKLPANEAFLRKLTKELKQSCGSGGTYGIEDESGYVEIQGDHRVVLRELLSKKAIVIRG